MILQVDQVNLPQTIGRLPSILANVIIIQGDPSDVNAVLFRSESLPSLMRTRAVLYPLGIVVKDFFRVAQHDDACGNRHYRGILKSIERGTESVQYEDEHVQPSKGCFVEGSVRVIEGSVRDEEPTLSEASTTEDDISYLNLDDAIGLCFSGAILS